MSIYIHIYSAHQLSRFTPSLSSTSGISYYVHNNTIIARRFGEVLHNLSFSFLFSQLCPSNTLSHRKVSVCVSDRDNPGSYRNIILINCDTGQHKTYHLFCFHCALKLDIKLKNYAVWHPVIIFKESTVSTSIMQNGSLTPIYITDLECECDPIQWVEPYSTSITTRKAKGLPLATLEQAYMYLWCKHQHGPELCSHFWYSVSCFPCVMLFLRQWNGNLCKLHAGCLNN